MTDAIQKSKERAQMAHLERMVSKLTQEQAQMKNDMGQEIK